MSNEKSDKFKKGLGLIEVLIALVLISTSMILAIRTVSRGLKVAKDNEIRDTAAGILLRALEFNQLDIPDTIFDPMLIQVPVVRCYSLQNVQNTSSNIFDAMQNVTGLHCVSNDPEISTCDASSPYLVNQESALICNQIIFTNYPLGQYQASNYFTDRIRITSITIYEIDNQEIVERIDTFKKIN